MRWGRFKRRVDLYSKENHSQFLNSLRPLRLCGNKGGPLRELLRLRSAQATGYNFLLEFFEGSGEAVHLFYGVGFGDAN
jgi:hypothetical protein